MLDPTKLSTEAQKALNDYLIEVVQHSYRCAHCMLNHNGQFCFFAYDCVRNDFSNWTDEPDE